MTLLCIYTKNILNSTYINKRYKLLKISYVSNFLLFTVVLLCQFPAKPTIVEDRYSYLIVMKRFYDSEAV